VDWQTQKDTFGAVYVNGFTEFSSKYDKGHPFYLLKQYEIGSPRRFSRGNPNDGTAFFDGYISFDGVSAGTKPSFAVVNKMSDNDIKFYGNAAMARIRPTKPQANLSQFLGELFTEGIPMVWRSADSVRSIINDWETLRRRALPTTGDAYLAVQFGLLPIISDLQKICLSLVEAHKLLGQYYSGSDTPVRRRYDFKPEESVVIHAPPTSLRVNTGGSDPFTANLSLSANSRSTKTTKYTWFTGSFQYHVARLYTSNKNASSRLDEFWTKANYLLGTKITPSVIWEIAPWSWLVDYFVGLGDAFALTDLGNTDNLVVRYGYLMRRTIVQDHWVYNQGVYNNVPVGPISRVLITDMKERYKATPFGFGVDPRSLTAGQAAILGSLVASRL
jgi:hypothetical protein